MRSIATATTTSTIFLPLGSMYPDSIYFGLKVLPIIGTLGPKYILVGYMDPEGKIRIRGYSSLAEVRGFISSSSRK